MKKTRDRGRTRMIMVAVIPAAALVMMVSCGGAGGVGGAGGGYVPSSTSSTSSSSSQSSSSSSMSSASASSGAGGGPCPDPGCAEAMYPLNRMMPLTISDNTALACRKSEYQGYCGIGTGSGPEMVYAIAILEDGTMHVTLDAPDWKSVLYAFGHGTCDKPNDVIACEDTKSGTTAFALKVAKGDVYPIVVDGRDSDSGPFTLKVSLQDPMCGDGVLDPGEDCDFGVAGGSPKDGCDANCHFITDPAFPLTDDCATNAYGVPVGKPITIPGSGTLPAPIYTSGYKDDYQACGALAGGSDRVFGFNTGKVTGTLKVEVSADFDVVLAAYTTCNGAPDGLVGCSDSATPNDPEHLSLPVKDGDNFRYVVVDGYDAKSFGSFTLTATLTSP